MIRALVIEDEPPILRNLCNEIERVDPEYRVVDTAMDGRRALQLIDENAYDVVFTDIRLPITSGLEIMQYIQSRRLDCYTVVISGYADFSYACSAITFNVKDYLLKPITENVLREVLSRAKATILQTKYAKQQSLLSKQIGLVATDQKPPTANLREKGDHYLPLLFRAGSPILCRSTATCPGARFFKSISLELLIHHALCNEAIDLYAFEGDNAAERMLVFQSSVAFAGSEISDIAQHCFGVLRQAADLPIFGVYSPNCVSFSTLRKELWHLQRVLEQNAVLGKSMLLNAEDGVPYKPDLMPLQVRFETTMSLLSRAERLAKLRDEAECLLEQALPVHLLRDFLRQLVPREADSEQQEIEESLNEILCRCIDAESFLSEICSLLSIAAENAFATLPLHRDIVATAKQYVENNYMHSISSATAAKELNYSIGYLNRMFHASTGTTFADYITHVRLHHALKHMQESPHLLMNCTLFVRQCDIL